MRTFYVEVSDDENWDRFVRVIKVKASTLNGAIKRAFKKAEKDETLYQVCTRVRGCELEQPVYDFWNGNISKHFGLNL